VEQVSGWGWAGVIVIGWLVVGAVAAPLVGRWLRHNSQYYPEAPPKITPEPPPTAASGAFKPCKPGGGREDRSSAT
jgi:hypothetical protein